MNKSPWDWEREFMKMERKIDNDYKQLRQDIETLENMKRDSIQNG